MTCPQNMCDEIHVSNEFRIVVKCSGRDRKVIMRGALVFFFVLAISPLVNVTWGQYELPLDQGILGLARTLKQLRTTTTVLHTVAHPDDEDGPLLAYCARGLGTRTLLFSITRGEGGANLISSHFFDELGALRTLEHLKSASFYGNELFYSRAADYGYSKTLDEAMRTWKNGTPILADLVELIRREQPTVVLSRFRGNRRDGHGHHQMAGVLTQRAFEAAADPTQFPEQLRDGLFVWQAEKLYSNNIRPGWRTEDKNYWTVEVPTGDFAPLIGRTFSQLARFGLGFQRSQGISGHWGSAGARPSYYRLLKSTNHSDLPTRESSILDGIESGVSSLIRYAEGAPAKLSDGLNEIDGLVEQIANDFNRVQPNLLTPQLLAGLEKTERLLADLSDMQLSDVADYTLSRQLERKASEFRHAVMLASGTSFEFWVDLKDDEQHLVPQRKFTVRSRIVKPGNEPLTVNAIRIVGNGWRVSGKEGPVTISDNKVSESEFVVEIDSTTASLTRPHWTRQDISQPFYEIIGKGKQRPMPRVAAEAIVQLQLGDAVFSIRKPIELRFREPELGNVRYASSVVPEISVRFASQYAVIPVNQTEFDVTVELRSSTSSDEAGSVKLALPAGWLSRPENFEIQFDRANQQELRTFRVHPSSPESGMQTIQAIATLHGKEYREGFQTVTARDLGRLTLFKPAQQMVRTVDAKIAKNLKVGYIAGSGDEVASAISQLGVATKTLSAADLESSDLSEFDVVLVGVRAYAVRPDIRRFNGRLLEFVKDGGTMIVQYQTPEFDNNFGPYPYKMGRNPEEVSEENAEVTMLDPEHVVFNRPNKITMQDFEGWVEQRGSKFWESWDDRYTPLLECHDSGQDRQEGGMLVTEYGKGIYVYSAYAWYRQLPNGVPGAYRLFANMLSLGQD